MSTPIIVLALSVFLAGMAAATSDGAQAIGYRDAAASEARLVVAEALESCGNAAGCAVPDNCTGRRCRVCRTGTNARTSAGTSVVATVTQPWSPSLLNHLAPAVGHHAVSVPRVTADSLSGFPAC